MSTSGRILNQPSQRETPRSCCCFVNTFIECHFFSHPALSFIEFSYNEFAMTISGNTNKNKKCHSWILYSSQLQLRRKKKANRKATLSKGRRRKRPVTERLKVCSSSKDLAVKASLLYYVNIACLTKCSNSKVHFFRKPWPSIKIKPLLR